MVRLKPHSERKRSAEEVIAEARERVAARGPGGAGRVRAGAPGRAQRSVRHAPPDRDQAVRRRLRGPAAKAQEVAHARRGGARPRRSLRRLRGRRARAEVAPRRRATPPASGSRPRRSPPISTPPCTARWPRSSAAPTAPSASACDTPTPSASTASRSNSCRSCRPRAAPRPRSRRSRASSARRRPSVLLRENLRPTVDRHGRSRSRAISARSSATSRTGCAGSFCRRATPASSAASIARSRRPSAISRASRPSACSGCSRCCWPSSVARGWPLVVLASVPLAVVGALVTLVVTGVPLNASSMMGCVLARRAGGQERHPAARAGRVALASGRRRSRPRSWRPDRSASVRS